jgi:predicted dinucleotide-binding enzyme
MAGNVTVLGAGIVGTNLATRLVELGHTVTFGARDPASAKVTAALEAVPGSLAVPLAEVPGDAELVVLAVPFDAVGPVLDAVGTLTGVILIDATNAVGRALPEGCTTVVDVIHQHRPEATVVKAFNTIGAEALLAPSIDSHALFMPLAGPSPAADAVAALAGRIGFDALVVGDDPAAFEVVEGFARLWIHLAFRAGAGRDFGFARLSRD